MYAYEFIAHDLAGLVLSGVTDGGMCEWIGTSQQFVYADYLEVYFGENQSFPKEPEDFAPYFD